MIKFVRTGTVHAYAGKLEEIALSCEKIFKKEKGFIIQELKIKISETAFNVYWRSLCDRENILFNIIEESDEAIVANNDIIYLRTVKQSLEKQAKEAGFRNEAFETSQDILDLSKM